MTFLVDTNVLSELRKQQSGGADRRVVQWAQSVQASDQFVSAITILELETGILLLQRRDALHGARLRAWLDTKIIAGFRGRILPVDEAVARHCAALNVPVTRPMGDALIAATALAHGKIVVTRNEADFAPMGVPLLNPWT